MIATQYEDPARRDREEVYAIRRILVRRLQKATRGIPRRERVTALRSFVAEWERLRVWRGMAALKAAVQQVNSGVAAASPVARAEVLGALADRKNGQSGRPRLQSTVGMGQVDLFTPQFVGQP